MISKLQSVSLRKGMRILKQIRCPLGTDEAQPVAASVAASLYGLVAVWTYGLLRHPLRTLHRGNVQSAQLRTSTL